MREHFPFLSQVAPHCPQALLTQARGRPAPRVALVNAGSVTALTGLRDAVDAGLAQPILIGDSARIRDAAQRIGWDISAFRLVHAPRHEAAPEAVRLVHAGEADAIMKGQVHTSTFLKALLPAAAGLREPKMICAHVFHITTPASDRPLLLTDAALNVTPNVATRQASLAHAVRLAGILDIPHPRAGILAPSEDPTPSVPNTMEAATIAAWAKSALPQAIVEGPMALDLIFSAEAAMTKNYRSDVAGDADIVLVPEITTGNALFKLMVLGMGCCAGGLLMGLKVPVLLTSRSQGSAARIASAALGAIVAGAGA
ncbi:MAG: phosphate acetyltransferase [Limimaricola sp.]|uniref:phosphate acyltransferase n=1 Tax=Limimaricola sp. TaxID=2211665 RepID=UPI001DBD092F|nr:phosphate acyltransferase [Limimaricola sp.]MBI1417550.1 phosphate acetyltransferase [Limimaricola sp.]